MSTWSRRAFSVLTAASLVVSSLALNPLPAAAVGPQASAIDAGVVVPGGSNNKDLVVNFTDTTKGPSVKFSSSTQIAKTCNACLVTLSSSYQEVMNGGTGTGIFVKGEPGRSFTLFIAPGYAVTNDSAAGTTYSIKFGVGSLNFSSTGPYSMQLDNGSFDDVSRTSLGTIVLEAKQNQQALSVASTTGTFNTPLTLTASGGSGTGALSFLVVAGGSASGCSVSSPGGVVTSTSAGTCFVTATKAGDATYSSVTSAQATVTLAKASRTISFAVTNFNVSYGNTVTVLATPSAGDGAVTYSAGSSTACSVNSSTRVVTATQATGSCEITATVAEGTNYLAASTTTSVVVTTGTRSATVTASGASVNFGTSYVMNALSSDLFSNDTISGATFIYEGTGSTTYAASSTMPTNAGTYSVTPSAAVFSTGNAANYNITYRAGTVTIARVARTLSFGGTTSATVNYGNTLTLTATPSAGDGDLTYSHGASTGCTVDSTTGVVTATSSTGTCVISASIAQGTNHLPASTDESFTVTLAKRAITLAASNLAVSFGDAVNPVGAITSGSLASSDEISGTTFTYAGSGSTVYSSSVTKPTAAGTYSVTPSVAVFSRGSATHYIITYSASTLTISARAITISVTALNVVSGAAVNPVFTVSTGTLIAGDEISGVTFTYAGSGTTVYSSSVTKPTQNGTYSVTPSAAVFSAGNSANYVITYAAGTLTIQAAPSSGSSPSVPAPSSKVSELSITLNSLGKESIIKVSLTKFPSESEQLHVVVRLLDATGAVIQEIKIPISSATALVEVPVKIPSVLFDVVAFTSNVAGVTESKILKGQNIRQPFIQVAPKRPAKLLGKTLGKDVIFTGNSTALNAQAKKALTQVAKLAKSSKSRIALTGFHTVSLKGSSFETRIAEKRALAVAKYLRSLGVESWIYYYGVSGSKARDIKGQARRVELRSLG